ncbi:MAG TPA: hypothetical protein VGG39_24655 [Polyangiaceae bacterium]|jgi:hypothetical protein
MTARLVPLAAAWLATLAFAVLPARPAAAADADASPASPPHETHTTVTLATGAGSVLDTARGAVPSTQGSLRLTLPLARALALELLGTAGFAFGHDEPDDAWLRLGLGLRLEDAWASVRPYASFRLVHIHFAPSETWASHPLDSFAGSSTEGLQHRSGMATAVGISFPVPRAGSPLRAMAEAELSWLPVGDPPSWFLGVEAGLGYAF